MSKEWHYSKGEGLSAGPVSFEELKGAFLNGEIGPDAFVWRRDFSGWKPILEIDFGKPPAPLQPEIPVEAKKKEVGVLGAAIIIGGLVLFIWSLISVSIAPPKSKEVKNTPSSDLKAAVRFSGTQFIIKNKNNFAWRDCRMEINAGVFGGGYENSTSYIKAGDTFAIGAMLFAKDDGERFNPLTTKPQNMNIHCDTLYGRGHWNGGWE